MKFGFRKPSFKKRLAARTSWKRVARHNLGLKAPRGWGWLTNPKRTAYNRVYNRTTFGLGSIGSARSSSSSNAGGCGCLLTLVIIGLGSLGAAAVPVVAGVLAVWIVVAVLRKRQKKHLALVVAAREAEAQRFRSIVLNERYGADIASRISRHEIWQGATMEMIVESLGQPLDISERVFKTKTKHVYKYGQTGRNRYALKITFENGVVVGWDDNR